MLHDMIVECKNPKQVHFFVDKHCIAMKLEPLTASKNALIKQRANMLLEYILGPLVDMSSRIEWYVCIDDKKRMYIKHGLILSRI